MLNAVKDIEGKVMGHKSSRREGRPLEGLRESLSDKVTFEQTYSELEEAGPARTWQNSIRPENWNLCRGSETRTVLPSRGSARRPVEWRRVS